MDDLKEERMLRNSDAIQEELAELERVRKRNNKRKETKQ